MFKKKRFHHGPRDTSWNRVAKWYDRHVSNEGSDFHRELIIPGVAKMLAPEKGEKILDLGCGQGVLSRELAKSGASVLGIDLSNRLIKIAQGRSKGIKDLEFRVLDASHLRGIDDKSFDAVVSVLAIQNMDPLGKVIAESARTLKLGGQMVLVLNHPCFRIARQSGWGFDDKRQLQYRRIDRYMSEMKIPIQMHPGSRPDVYTWTFHRPLSSYFGALTANGLFVNKLEEWVSGRESLPGKKARAENLSRKEIPLFLAISAVKF